MTIPNRNPPVTDWTTDFDHTDPGWATDPFSIWADLGARCPVAHTDRYGGAWLPTRYEDISAIAYDTEHFSSQGVIVNHARPRMPAPIGPAPPITSDPPFHQQARRLLLPAFAPKAIAEWEPSTRALCGRLLDGLAGHDLVDGAVDYAQHVPVDVIARMLGLPPGDGDLFRQFVRDVIESVFLPPGERAARFEAIGTYIDGAVEDHIAHPRDDLIGYLLDVTVDGETLSPRHVRGTIELLLIAGVDTTWSAIGASIWHLANVPADRRRLVEEPALIPVAVEELLRAYAPVTMARLVARGDGVAGLPDEAGRVGAPSLPCRQPRSRSVPGRRSGRDRPSHEPARRVRPWHPSVHRVEPGPARGPRRRRGMAGPLPRLRAGRPRRRDLGDRSGAGPPHGADPHPRPIAAQQLGHHVSGRASGGSTTRPARRPRSSASTARVSAGSMISSMRMVPAAS